METDTSISDILRETIAFLESLRDMQLPLALENLRVKLLARSKNTLSAATRAGASSPEPYLDMNSGPKSILLKSEDKLEEYVEKEESQKQTHQDYYETFENGIIIVTPAENSEDRNDEDRDEDKALIGIYKNLSAAQIRSKCHKCGPVYKKEGKKLFLSEGRTCWIALIESHLLIYRSERHNRPMSIHSIRGYMARPAPNLIPRDRQRSELAFEMYKPGSETLQFIARTRKDMEQWVAKVCLTGSCNEECANDKAEEHKIQIVQSSSMSRKDNDTARRTVKGKSDIADGARTKGKTASSKKTAAEHENAPPLPARIPLMPLPSLPPSVTPLDYSNTTVVQYDDDDDEIYHKIEDLQNEKQYQNLSKKKIRAAKNKQSETARNESDVGRDEGETAKENSCDAVAEEIYDDVTLSLSRINATAIAQQNNSLNDRPVANDDETQEDLYDDVDNLIPKGKLGKDRAKEDQIDASPSKLQKKSFLNRVLSRRESSGKLDKRCKSKGSPESAAPLVSEKTTPTYIDVLSEPKEEISAPNVEEELSEYNCPPPPRPITPNSANNLSRTEEVYDDVSACREECGSKNQQKTHNNATQDSQRGATEATDDNAKRDNIMIVANGSFAEEEIEHYQSPKSGLCVGNALENQQNEELYDDIALWTEFRSRQRRDVIERKRDNEDNTKPNDKRSWNRFTNRRSRATSDSNCANETNRQSGNENEETDDSARRNTFQKLISKMENSLARVSARNQSSFSTSKSSTASNNNF